MFSSHQQQTSDSLNFNADLVSQRALKEAAPLLSHIIGSLFKMQVY